MKNIIFVAIYTLGLTACVKEKTTNQNGYIVNATAHVISIHFVKNSGSNDTSLIRLSPGEKVTVGDSWARGDVSSPGFNLLPQFAIDLNGYAFVIFNDTHLVYHYLNYLIDSTSKHYFYSSNRNLLNPNSYQFEKIRSKNTRTNNHVYTFTEEDYNFAKE